MRSNKYIKSGFIMPKDKNDFNNTLLKYIKSGLEAKLDNYKRILYSSCGDKQHRIDIIIDYFTISIILVSSADSGYDSYFKTKNVPRKHDLYKINHMKASINIIEPDSISNFVNYISNFINLIRS